MNKFEEKFYQELKELKGQGYIDNNSTIACPQVGGDHDSEVWDNKDGIRQADVCFTCKTIVKK